MLHSFEVPNEDEPNGTRLVSPADAGGLLHDLSSLLENVSKCEFCRMELLRSHELRSDLLRQVCTMKVLLKDLEAEAWD